MLQGPLHTFLVTAAAALADFDCLAGVLLPGSPLTRCS